MGGLVWHVKVVAAQSHASANRVEWPRLATNQIMLGLAKAINSSNCSNRI
jgi:hypothetical protein